MKQYKPVIDNFSAGAEQYAAFRPESPDAIYDFMYAHVGHFGTARDCGTGNGQVAARLAEKFETVYASDISNAQMAHAVQKPNISYHEERAENSTLADNSVDLITVAQAIHWFDFDHFYDEVRRVSKDGAFFCAWTYNLLSISPEVNAVIDHLYKDITHPYWDKQRDLVDAGYATIPFPFEEIAAPAININKMWSLDHVVGYLGTWSGTGHYRRKTGNDPVAMVYEDLKTAWGPNELKAITWPVNVRAGIVRL